jgi:molybdopterin converting factor small subunit
MLAWLKEKTQSWQRDAKKPPPKSTLTIRVKFMGDLPAVIGQRQIEVELPLGSVLGDLMTWLSNTYGEAFTARVFAGPAKLHHYILVFVDGKNIKGNGGFDMPLGDGEVDVIMLPMFGGG